MFCQDPQSGLRAIIAIYSTALGPALGGTRFYPYPDEDAALADVLALSKAMAYKAACAGRRPRRRQGRHPRRPGDDEDRAAAARLRAHGRVARRPLLHGLRRRHLRPGHGRHRQGVAVRHRPLAGARRRRRQRGPHGVRRLPGHARCRPAHLGSPDAARQAGRCRGRRQGRPPPRRAPARGRRDGRRRRRQRAAARPGPRASRPRGVSADVPTSRPPTWTSTPPARSVPRSPTTWPQPQGEGRLRRRQQPAGPPGPREGARRPRHPLHARLRRQRRRADPGRRRGIEGFRFERAKAKADADLRHDAADLPLADAEGVPPAVAADRVAERRMAEVGRLRTVLLP